MTTRPKFNLNDEVFVKWDGCLYIGNVIGVHIAIGSKTFGNKHGDVNYVISGCPFHQPESKLKLYVRDKFVFTY